MPLRRSWPAFVLGALLVYLVVVPLALLLLSSVKPEGFVTDRGFTFANYLAVYRDPAFPRLVATTLAFVAGATSIAVALGAGLAFLVERTDLPARRLVRALVVVPMATPPLLTAIGWIMLLSPRSGFFNQALIALFQLRRPPFDVFGLPGMIFVEGLVLVPSAFLMLSPALRGLDAGLEHAALLSGAPLRTVVRRVTLPLVAPALLAAASFLSIAGFVVFDVPGALGMPARVFVLSSRIFADLNESTTGLPLYGRVSALATFFLALLILLGLAYQRLTREGRRFAAHGGPRRRWPVLRLGWARPLVFATVAGYFLLAVVAPFGALVWASLMPYASRISPAMFSRLTLDNHRSLAHDPLLAGAVRNTLLVAAASATAVTLLSAAISWMVSRSRNPARRVVDLLAFLPVGMPGVLIAVALIQVYLTLSALPVYGTIWIIALAYLTTYLSYGSRAANAAVVQLHRDLEDAGRVSGAGFFTIFRRIIVPLLSPALLAIWVWVFAHAGRELSAALLLHGRDNTVVTTLLWDYWSGGEPSKAAAVGVWLTAASAALIALFEALSGDRAAEASP